MVHTSSGPSRLKANAIARLRTLLQRGVEISMRSPLAKRVATRQYSHPIIKWAWGIVSGPLRHGISTVSTGPARGLRIDAGGSAVAYAIGNAEMPVQATFVNRLRPGMTVLDIGANVGFMSLLAARLVGDGGVVVALEPVPANAERIRANALLNDLSNVRVLEFAASDQNDVAQMYISGHSAFSRLVSTSRPGSVIDVIDVRTRSIDALVAEGAIPRFDLVKIDVEGAELSVLAGMRKTIDTDRPDILCEVHGCNAAFAALMSDLNYVVTNLDEDVPVERGQHNVHTLSVAAERAGSIAGARS